VCSGQAGPGPGAGTGSGSRTRAKGSAASGRGAGSRGRDGSIVAAVAVVVDLARGAVPARRSVDLVEIRTVLVSAATAVTAGQRLVALDLAMLALDTAAA